MPGEPKAWGLLAKDPMALALHKGTKDVTRRVGDRWAKCGAGRVLWVRETWEQVHPCQVAEGRYNLPGEAGIPGPPPVRYRVIYRADGPYPGNVHTNDGHPYRRLALPGESPTWDGPADAWTPSIHMPRWASRTTLRTVSVTREDWTPETRLSEDEARREGFASADEFHALWTAMHPGFAGVVWRIEVTRG